MSITLKHFWLSLKVRLTLLTLVIILLSIWSLVYYASNLLRDDLRRILGEQQFNTASIVAENVNQEIDFRLRSLENVAKGIPPAAMRNTASLQNLLIERPILAKLFNGGYFATDADGTATASIPLSANRRGINYIERDHVAAALREGKATVSKPTIGKMLHAPVVSMSAPILDSQGRIIGSLVGVVDLSKPNFFDEITNNSYGRTGGYLLIAPKHNLIVTATDKKLIMKAPPAPGINPLYDRYVKGYEGSGVVVDSRGVEVLSSAKQVPVAGWLLVARIPTKEAFTPINNLLHHILVAGIILTIASGASIWWLLRRQLSPMLDTVESLSTISVTDGTIAPLKVVRQDEVGHMITAFNRLLEIVALREENLTASQKLISRLLQNTDQGVYGIDSNGHCTFINKAALTMLGLKAEACIGKDMHDLIHHSYASGIPYAVEDCPIFKAKLSGEGCRVDNEVLWRSDGTSFQAEYSSHPIIENGAITGAVVTFSDITRRKQTEESIISSNNLLHLIINTAPLHIFWKDNELNYLGCNRAFALAAGLSNQDEIVGKDDYQLRWKELAEIYRTDDRRVIESGVPKLSYDEPLISTDGSIIWIRTSKVPLTNEHNETIGLLGVYEDITERKLAEEALLRSEKRLKEAQRIACIGDWELDLTNNMLVWSDEIFRIFEINPKDFSASYEYFLESIHPDDREAVNLAYTDSLKHKTPYEIKHRLLMKDGSVKHVFERCETYFDSDGNPLQSIGTVQDITQIILAEEEKDKLEIQLQQAQKLESIGQLAGGVAHDFNNMLGVILGHAELALMKMEPSNPLHEELYEIRTAAERSADLTRQLLTFARKQTISPKIMNLNETIAGTLKMLQRLIGEDIYLTWQPAPELWQIKADPSQIDQILANLCVNARDAIEDTGRITIETRNNTIDDNYCKNHPDVMPGEYVHLGISDNGSGMDKNTLSRIFEPFFTTKELGKGTGLGLATVFGIVKQNNGFIDVFSEPGRGTTFSIHLPRNNETNSESLDEGAAVSIPRGEETILLVEDEPAILRMASMMLGMQGYKVLTAGTTDEAIRLAREHFGEIHLIITDVIMPEMNGKDLANSLQSVYPDLKSLFMSGYTADVIAQHGVLSEQMHFIQKPFTLPDLAKKVRDVLDK